MSRTVALSGLLPEGDGLSAIARLLVTEPDAERIIVAVVDTVKITQRIDDDTSVPTVRIRRIEVLTDHKDQTQTRTMLEREFERRTGQTPLPFEDEEPKT